VSTTFLRTRAGVIDAVKIMDLQVVNPEAEKLGKIESLMLDLSEGRILYAVLSFGGFLGMGDKLFPVPIQALTFRMDANGSPERCILNVAKNALENAPGYDLEHLPDSVDRSFVSQVYSHYGYTPYWDE
jgi:hypothetical protein